MHTQLPVARKDMHRHSSLHHTCYQHHNTPAPPGHTLPPAVSPELHAHRDQLPPLELLYDPASRTWRADRELSHLEWEALAGVAFVEARCRCDTCALHQAVAPDNEEGGSEGGSVEGSEEGGELGVELGCVAEIAPGRVFCLVPTEAFDREGEGEGEVLKRFGDGRFRRGFGHQAHHVALLQERQARLTLQLSTLPDSHCCYHCEVWLE